MRGVLLSLGLACAIAFALPNVQPTSSLPGSPVISGSASAFQDATPPKVNVDINVNRGGGGYWHRNPVWIAIGALAAVVIILLIAMAVRGGGTTIIKE